MEPKELRLLAYAALGNACKGIQYFSYGEKPPFISYDKSPVLLKEIGLLNADIKNLQPLLGESLHLSTETIGGQSSGYRIYKLWTPNDLSDADMAIVVRNLDYQMDRRPNNLGSNPRCTINPKKNLVIKFARPSWLTIQDATDALTGQAIPYKQFQDMIKMEIDQMETGKIIWLKNTNKEFKYEISKSS